MIPIAKPLLNQAAAQAAYDTVLSGWVTQGPQVKAFEDAFAHYVGAKHAVALSNCTTALHLAMIVAGIGPGDEVICPSMSYVATANSIRYVGATPVFAEVHSETYNLDAEDVRRRIGPKTKAILLVHQIGLPADIDAFKALCAEHSLTLIEDAACAAGSAYKGAKIGSHSDLVCFSFHPRKVITTGDGGMITTSRADIAERLRLLRQHGMSVSDVARHGSSKILFEDHLELAYNYRMTDIQAAVGLQQLAILDDIIAQRRAIAQRYFAELADLHDIIRLPQEPAGYFTNWQSFSIYLKPSCPIARNDLMQLLLDRGIATRRGIMLTHRETAYKNEPYGNVSLPVSEDANERSILIPLFAQMTEDEVSAVIREFRAALGRA